jgi:hypothetical protein
MGINGAQRGTTFAFAFVAASVFSQSSSGFTIDSLERNPSNIDIVPFESVKCHGLGCVGRAVGKAASDTANAAKKAADDAARASKKAADDAANAARKAADDAASAAKKAANDAAKATQQVVKDTTVTIAKAGNDTVKTIEKAGGDTIKTVEKAGGDTTRTIQKAGGDTITTVRKTSGDVVTTYRKAGSDSVTMVAKGWRDVGDQTKREFKDLVDAGTAVGKFAVSEIKADGNTLIHAERLIREGKVIDAIWALQTEPLKNVEANTETALQESTLLRAVAEGAATFYGGPAGAAAYAAWYTYRTTGDANMALRIGLQTGLTNTVAGAGGQMPSGTALEVAKKSLVSGAIGGLTVAAAGGNADSIKKGFLEAGSKILVQDGYQQIAGQPLDDKTSARVAYCMSALNASCLPKPQELARDAAGNVLDAAGNKLDPDGIVRDAAGKIVTDINGFPKKGIPQIIGQLVPTPGDQIGPWIPANDHSMDEEKAAVMTTLSTIPGMNTVTVLDGAWTLSWNTSAVETASLVYPAVVLTRAGDHTPLYERVESMSASAAENLTSVLPPPAPPKLDYYRSYICTSSDATQTIDAVSDGQQGCRVSYDAGPAGIITMGIGAQDVRKDCAPIAAAKAAQLKLTGLACLAR